MKARTLIICTIALLLPLGCSKSKETYEKSFKESFNRSFVKSCVASATKGGIKEELVRPKCECAGKYLIEKFTSVELTKLSAGNSPEVAKIIDEAVNSCK